MTHEYHLHRLQVVAAPREEVFAFFADPQNLQRLTPDFLAFRLTDQSQTEMGDGLRIEYRLKLYGIPLSWQSEIRAYDPPRQFVDVQLKGPYRRWHHLHRFEAVGEGTRIVDDVHYELPLGGLGRIAHWLLVRRSLNTIFDYRIAAIEQIFANKTDATTE